MKMKPVDIGGTLYSEGGLRFGGFQTGDFLSATDALDEERPGVRKEIVAEAHYQVVWFHRFPEMAFLVCLLFGIPLPGSIALLCCDQPR